MLLLAEVRGGGGRVSEIVLGVGTSHSPMLVLPPSRWREWGERRDPSLADLADESGFIRPFEDWVESRASSIEPELSDEVLEAKGRRCREATDALAERIREANIDALVVVGDDQSEHIDSTNLPPILIHHGSSVYNETPPTPAGAPEILRLMDLGYYEPEVRREYPIDVELAESLIANLLDGGFDVATSSQLPKNRSEGHAFQYVHRHLAPPGIPSVLVLLNTYVPPAQPRARRCVEFGRALRSAIASSPGGRRVGVVASGGLSHFLVSETLDRMVLDACKANDLETLCSISERALQSGSSEIKNWMVVAGACDHLAFEVLDYVPGYRTAAGTGTGLAFASWGPS